MMRSVKSQKKNNMIVEQLYTKCLAEAAYYIESNGEVAIIDPMRETDQYVEIAKNNGAQSNISLKLTFMQISFLAMLT